MGMIDRFLGMGSTVAALGDAASGMAEILTPSATRRLELDEDAYARAIGEQQAEFAAAPAHWFDAAMNGLNRLPRPLLTLGTIGLFVYAMVEPAGFSARMEGLALVPEPLWWLMGAIVSFYFGAREAHYFRARVWPNTTVRTKVMGRADQGWRAPAFPPDDDGAWRAPVLPGYDGLTGAAPEAASGAASGGSAEAVSGAVVAEVEQRLDESGAAVAAPARDDFADNPALREWARSLTPAMRG